ncbi:unnamed protein product [Trichogramma brassicae]|uniref:39S ribosomal protein L33, mitochondrial n=1 Tax=Trichogramma brassicae TaxID=86971 RepID=A0A6H5IEP0_9HYME|nr:unnamed protein product [Trichogramma brassicae]
MPHTDLETAIFQEADIMVLMESVASKHKVITVRERLGDKMEFFRFDPYIQKNALYKEKKKIKSV